MPLPHGAEIGIELETNFLVVVGKSHKDVVFEDDEIRIDADTAGRDGGALEFVIKKTASGRALCAAAERCAAIATKIVEACRPSRDSTTAAPPLELFGADGRRPIVAPDADVKIRWERAAHLQSAAAQFTMGVPLRQMGPYLVAAAEHSAYYQDRKGILARIHALVVHNAPEVAVGREVWKGFIALFALYLYDLQTWNPNDASTEGPKNALTVMARTSFREIYLGLVGRVPAREVGLLDDMVRVAQTVLHELVPGGKGRDIAETKLILKSYPFADGRKQAGSVTILDWIMSIGRGLSADYRRRVVGDKPSDNGEPDGLCPPEGFDALDPRYSLGAMKMAGELVVIEHRNPNVNGDDGIVAPDDWIGFANAAFSFAKCVLAGEEFGGADEADVAA